MSADRWTETNRAWWDERAPLHAAGGFYDLERFRHRGSTLRPFERHELGDVAGKNLVHLQCHLGLDTLSWARLGARVTGLDFSAPAVGAANALAADLALDASFVEGDVHDAPDLLGRTFDVAYTGVGALCWLPDIPRWAGIVARLLRPGGVLYLVETHPMSDILGDDDLVARYPHFTREPIREETAGSYAEPDAATSANETFSWIHPLSRVIDALLGAGLAIERFAEHDFTAFRRWPFMLDAGDGVFRMPPGMPSLPLLYSLLARAGAPSHEGGGAAPR